MIEEYPERGEIYLVDFGKVEGAQIEKTRPALVIQNDLGNRYSPHTIVVAVRSAEEKKLLPVFVSVPEGIAGLTKDSLIDCGHISTVLKVRLGNRIGKLPTSFQAEVDKALKISLDLS